MDDVLTPDEVASILKVSRETVRKLLVSGQIAWIPAGNGSSRYYRRIEREAFEEYRRRSRRASVTREVRNIRQTFDAMKNYEERW